MTTKKPKGWIFWMRDSATGIWHRSNDAEPLGLKSLCGHLFPGSPTVWREEELHPDCRACVECEDIMEGSAEKEEEEPMLWVFANGYYRRATRTEILSHPVAHEVIRLLVEQLHEEYHSGDCKLETCSFWPEGSK